MTQDRHEDLRPITQVVNGTGGDWATHGEWFGLVLTDLRLALDGAEVRYVDWVFTGRVEGEFTAQIMVFTKDLVLLAEYATDGSGIDGPNHTTRGTSVWSRKELRALHITGDQSIRLQNGSGNVGVILNWRSGSTSVLPLQSARSINEDLLELIPSLLADLPQ